jgi:hypothetical protein
MGLFAVRCAKDPTLGAGGLSLRADWSRRVRPCDCRDWRTYQRLTEGGIQRDLLFAAGSLTCRLFAVLYTGRIVQDGTPKPEVPVQVPREPSLEDSGDRLQLPQRGSKVLFGDFGKRIQRFDGTDAYAARSAEQSASRNSALVPNAPMARKNPGWIRLLWRSGVLNSIVALGESTPSS